MELDAASLAIGRIERALSRLECANLTAAGALPPRQGDLLAAAPHPPSPPPADDPLRSEVKAVIAELDRLIAQVRHG